jgi:hypothetical protein
MGHGKNSQKRPPADGSRPETREEKRNRIARNKAKAEQTKKLLPTIIVRSSHVVVVLLAAELGVVVARAAGVWQHSQTSRLPCVADFRATSPCSMNGVPLLLLLLLSQAGIAGVVIVIPIIVVYIASWASS